MPVHKEGKGCYQYGNSGKKYCGKSAVAKAYAQAKANPTTEELFADALKALKA